MNKILEKPDYCNMCNKNISETGYSFSYKDNGTIIKVLCFKCKNTEDLENYNKTGILTSNLFLKAVCDRGLNSIKKSLERIELEISNFELNFFLAGFQKMNSKTKHRGFVGSYNEITLMTYTTAGRVMITIKDDNSNITLIGQENDDVELRTFPKIGLQGINATEENAITLLQLAQKYYTAGNLKLKKNNNVNIGF